MQSEFKKALNLPNEMRKNIQALFTGFLSLPGLWRRWIGFLGYPPADTPLTPEAEMLRLCCRLFGKTEAGIRHELTNLSLPISETEGTNRIFNYSYKCLTVKCKPYLLQFEFVVEGKRDSEEDPSVYCLHICITYRGKTSRRALLKALSNKKEYFCLWKDWYVDNPANRMKIMHGDEYPYLQLPGHIAFSLSGVRKQGLK